MFPSTPTSSAWFSDHNIACISHLSSIMLNLSHDYHSIDVMLQHCSWLLDTALCQTSSGDSVCAPVLSCDDAHFQPVQELFLLLAVCTLCRVSHQPPTVHCTRTSPGVWKPCSLLGMSIRTECI
jgi:hypothetical protein